MAEPYNQSDKEDIGDTFDAKMLLRIQTDFANARAFMKDFHRTCLERYEMYHASGRWESLREKNLLPDSFYQEQIDVLTADMCDKLFYADRPCQMSPMDENYKADADAKQQLMDWQDYEDKIYQKVRGGVKDAANYGIGVGQIDYCEKKRKRLVPVKEPITVMDSITGLEQGMVGPDGQPLTRTTWQMKEEFVFRGPRVKRVDPMNFFVTGEKSEVDDEFPIMVRSEQPKSFFTGKSYWINVDAITDMTGKSDDGLTEQKRAMIGLDPRTQPGSNSKLIEYVEWQGKVNQVELYTFEGKPTEEVDPTAQVWCIAGMANRGTLVRLQESPFDFEGPNVVVGTLEKEEGELLSLGIGHKIAAITKSMQVLNGIWMENMKQSVNPPTILNTTSLVKNTEIKVNKAGAVIQTNGDPSKVAMRLEQPQIGKDLYAGMDMLRQRGQNASAVQDLISGRGDQAVGTATESNAVAMQASLRIRDYIRTFEETFIQPLYDKRNAINVQYLDAEYVYGIIGDAAIEWHTITPDQVKVPVEFLCLASSRETQRAVLTQQLIQVKDVAGMCEQAGFPLRWDLYMQKLLEGGLTWQREETEKFVPTIKAETDMNIPIGDMMIQKFLVMQGAAQMTAMGGAQQAMTPEQGGEPPQPGSETEAVDSATQRNTAGML